MAYLTYVQVNRVSPAPIEKRIGAALAWYEMCQGKGEVPVAIVVHPTEVIAARETKAASGLIVYSMNGCNVPEIWLELPGNSSGVLEQPALPGL